MIFALRAMILFREDHLAGFLSASTSANMARRRSRIVSRLSPGAFSSKTASSRSNAGR